MLVFPWALIIAATSGCGAAQDSRRSTPNDPIDVQFTDSPDEVEYSTGLAYQLDEGLDFSFCPTATDLNLLNASWLAYFSANQYAHFAHLGPMLESLEFGRENEGMRWAGCARDLYAVRELEDNDALPYPLDDEAVAGWGVCIREWISSSFGGQGGEAQTGVAGAFERHLIHEVHPDAMIQFFSGGEFDIEEMHFEAGTTQVMWARHRTMPLVIIVFRGTEMRRGQMFRDGMADLRFRMVDMEGWGRVHRGFNAGLEAVDHELLRAKLEEIEGSGAPIWVTGHSLGAALATLLSARILDMIDEGADLDLAGVYTFGSPRVGNQEFAETFEESIERHGVSAIRFRHANDVVTRIPISMFSNIEYEHVGQLVYLDRDGEMNIEPEELPRGLYHFFSDHSSTEYYERIHDLANDPANARFLQCRR